MTDESNSAAQAQALWRRLVKVYPSLTIAWDSIFSRESWSMIGTDLVTGVLVSKKARSVATILAEANDTVADAPSAIARVNAERATAIFRNVAISYITLPIAVAALMSDAAPDEVRRLLSSNLQALVTWALILLVTPIVFFFFMWRAKQLAWSIELVRAGAVEPSVRR